MHVHRSNFRNPTLCSFLLMFAGYWSTWEAPPSLLQDVDQQPSTCALRLPGFFNDPVPPRGPLFRLLNKRKASPKVFLKIAVSELDPIYAISAKFINCSESSLAMTVPV